MALLVSLCHWFLCSFSNICGVSKEREPGILRKRWKFHGKKVPLIKNNQENLAGVWRVESIEETDSLGQNVLNCQTLSTRIGSSLEQYKQKTKIYIFYCSNEGPVPMCSVWQFSTRCPRESVSLMYNCYNQYCR